MKIRFYISIFLGKIIYLILKILGLNATTLPGRISLYIYPNFLKEMSKYFKIIILITGTNGKTTVNNLTYQILKQSGYKVLSNLEGANLKTGIATSFLKNPNYYDYGTFEVDEGVFPYIYRELNPQIVVITNFFRDQLDRYGEIDKLVKSIYKSLDKDIILILNGDDPFTVRFDTLKNCKKYFFGVNNIGKEVEEIRESIYCPLCGRKLNYLYFNFAQLGRFYCECGFSNPKYDFIIENMELKNGKLFFVIKEKDEKLSLSFNYYGIYNLYNVIAGYSIGRVLNISKEKIKNVIESFQYFLGRWERFHYNGKEKILVLVKNPIGYNQVLDLLIEDDEEKILLLILNDNIADGRDISWIWDVDFEKLKKDKNIKKIYCSGKRAEDLVVRLKYAEIPLNKIILEKNILRSIKNILKENNKAYILPTYTALFYSRKTLLKYTRYGNKNITHVS